MCVCVCVCVCVYALRIAISYPIFSTLIFYMRNSVYCPSLTPQSEKYPLLLNKTELKDILSHLLLQLLDISSLCVCVCVCVYLLDTGSVCTKWCCSSFIDGSALSVIIDHRRLSAVNYMYSYTGTCTCAPLNNTCTCTCACACMFLHVHSSYTV